ncbi:hypothetical protein AWV80_18985 [Cupriavidus sp. UYMU48A]|nr:hypothetical protein AWV80_18985 [Cupriavidus sp. UYMU48A]
MRHHTADWLARVFFFRHDDGCWCVFPPAAEQIAQFGIGKQIHIAGLQQELESLEAMPPEARVGFWSSSGTGSSRVSQASRSSSPRSAR